MFERVLNTPLKHVVQLLLIVKLLAKLAGHYFYSVEEKKMHITQRKHFISNLNKRFISNLTKYNEK